MSDRRPFEAAKGARSAHQPPRTSRLQLCWQSRLRTDPRRGTLGGFSEGVDPFQTSNLHTSRRPLAPHRRSTRSQTGARRERRHARPSPATAAAAQSGGRWGDQGEQAGSAHNTQPGSGGRTRRCQPFGRFTGEAAASGDLFTHLMGF